MSFFIFFGFLPTKIQKFFYPNAPKKLLLIFFFDFFDESDVRLDVVFIKIVNP